MVVHLTSDGYTEDSKQPVDNIPIGQHWVAFDYERWDGDDEYRARLRRLYQTQAPAFLYGKTPFGIDLDQVTDDGLLKILNERGAVGDHRDSFRHLVISSDKQTGDVPHIAAAMVHDPMLDVIIVHTPAGAATVADMKATYQHVIGRSPALEGKNPYISLRQGGDRVSTLQEDVDTKYSWYPALMPDDAVYGALGPPLWRSTGADHQHIYTYERGDGARVEYKMMRVGGATTLLADTYSDLGPELFFAVNAHAMTAADIDKDAAVAFFQKFYDLDLAGARQRFLLVWSRYSGRKPGGYNPAGDSSIVGNEQLISLAASTGRIPITIGHNPPGEKKETPRGKIHLGEFWNHPDKSNPFAGKGRPGQTNFYTLFHAAHDVVQVGQKTGGMDNAALVGMRTVYIEDVNSRQQDRMTKWVHAMKHYRRAAVQRPPKRLGQVIREITATPGAPQLHLRTDSEEFTNARAMRDAYQKGYTNDDLKRIEEEILALDS